MINEKRELRRETRMSARRVRREAHHRDLEGSVRYAVRFGSGASVSTHDVSSAVRLSDPMVASAVMGTHETLAHARRRLGWT